MGTEKPLMEVSFSFCVLDLTIVCEPALDSTLTNRVQVNCSSPSSTSPLAGTKNLRPAFHFQTLMILCSCNWALVEFLKSMVSFTT